MLVTYPVATVLLGVTAATAGGPVHSGALLWGSLYGISQAIGVYWFYAAVSTGPISVVSPLAARQRYFHFDFSLGEVEFQRNQREVTITYLADQSVDLAPVE